MRSLSLQVPWLNATSARGLRRQKQYDRKRLEKPPLQQEDKCEITSAFLRSVLSLGATLDCS